MSGRTALRGTARYAAVPGRGSVRLCRSARRRWEKLPPERRGPTAAAVVVGAVLVWLMPLGVPVAGIAALVAVVVAGLRPAPEPGEPGDPVEDPDAPAVRERCLAMLREALTPWPGGTGPFGFPPDGGPDSPGGADAGDAGTDSGEPGEPSGDGDGDDREPVRGVFDHRGRPVALGIRYPGSFPDWDPTARERVEGLVTRRLGHRGDVRFDWDGERGVLAVRPADRLPDGIGAQPFVTPPDTIVLGFTDPESGDRTVPVRRLPADDPGRETVVHAPPLVWRTGPASPAPHLLVVGEPRSGVTGLLRSVVLQALRREGPVEVAVVDGAGGGWEFLRGRHGVRAVEHGPTGAAALVEWAAVETERRLRSRGYRRDAPPALWLVLDRPSVPLAAGAADPVVAALLRRGRAAGVTVVVGEQIDHLPPAPGWAADLRAAVVLGAVGARDIAAVVGPSPWRPGEGPGAAPPTGCGFARLDGTGVHRLRVPVTPAPDDVTAPDAWRRAVLALAPERPVSLERVAPPPRAEGPEPLGPAVVGPSTDGENRERRTADGEPCPAGRAGPSPTDAPPTPPRAAGPGPGVQAM
ncbi:hypothetical protein [Streptomyces sp. ST2-7A]|uniref:hypothetical protein n=1 Tax=Streptomyces sp. ST2-7A TaxID=2907214 RepID=UPI001F23BEBF|nr:hypothetical protein [Streptomyces sp. ST2-7A]MCE7079651.1 hypothetical protein [Streptomyces sp. ST2-7A]